MNKIQASTKPLISLLLLAVIFSLVAIPAARAQESKSELPKDQADHTWALCYCPGGLRKMESRS